MRYAVIRGYRMAGPLHQYGFAEFSHETPKRIVTKDPIHHRSIHAKADLVCLCETKEQAEGVCATLAEAKARYLSTVDAAGKYYERKVARIVEQAREQADQLTAEVEEATRSRPLRRARGFQPTLIKGGIEE